MNYKKLTVVFIAILCSCLGIAQNTGTGIPRFGSFTGGTPFDVVNNQNLNVHFTLGLVSIATRSGAFSFAAINDSQMWKPINSVWTPATNAAGLPTWGWTIGNPNGGLSRNLV